MKRNENFNNNFNNKKAKLEANVNYLWGEGTSQQENIENRNNENNDFDDDIWGLDPNIDEIDRCIEFATQATSTNVKNISTFISYDDFKVKTNMCSTQNFFPQQNQTNKFVFKNVPESTNSSSSTSTSAYIINKDNDEEITNLVEKVKTLETQKNELAKSCETKNGEIAILRSQLKQVQKVVDTEKAEKLKNLQETHDKFEAKFSVLTKEISSLKCEIELKNLEITNLKEKITELKKMFNSNMSLTVVNNEITYNSEALPKLKVLNTTDKDTQTEPDLDFDDFTNLQIRESLQDLVPTNIFEQCYDKNCKEISKSFASVFRRRSTKTNYNLICFNTKHVDIQNIINCDTEEINSCKKIEKIVNQFLDTCKGNLLWFLNELKTYENNSNLSNNKNMLCINLELDDKIEYSTDCIFSGTLLHKNEYGSDVRRYIAFMSFISLYYIKFITKLNNEENCMDVDNEDQISILNLIANITSLIKTIKKSEEYCGVLAAILKFLSSLLIKNSLSVTCYENFNKVIKDILISRPNKIVFKYLCECLKFMSFHEVLIQSLCTMKKAFKESNKEFYFSEDCCTFKILSIQLENMNLDAEMTCNVIQFLHNILMCDVKWLYDAQTCDCIQTLYSLGVKIISKIINKYPKIKPRDKTKYFLYTIFDVGVTFFCTLISRFPKLLNKRNNTYVQFYGVINYIDTNKDELCLKDNHETALGFLTSSFDDEILEETEENISGSKDYILDKIFSSF